MEKCVELRVDTDLDGRVTGELSGNYLRIPRGVPSRMYQRLNNLMAKFNMDRFGPGEAGTGFEMGRGRRRTESS